jgi:copper transport protein
MRRVFISAVAALAFVVLAAGSASAHALLQSSDPAPNSVVKVAPAELTLTFTEAPDPKLSSVRVVDGNGAAVTSGPVATVAGLADELSVSIGPLPDGVYTVAWRTVSAVDGHLAAGSYAFSVGTAAPPTGATGPAANAQTTSGAAWGVIAARWILYVGLLGLLGAAFLGSVLLKGGLRLPLRLAALEVGVAIVGTVLLIAFQLGDAGASPADLPGTSLGYDAILRLAPLLLAACLLATTFRVSERAARALLAAGGAIAALELLVEATLSHAASEPLPQAEIALQWLHLSAVGLWLGGLTALLIELRGPAAPAKAELARRFAVLAGLGLVVVAVTGVLRSVVDVGTLNALVSTDFGRLVLLKSGLLVPLAALGALNHFRNVPRAASDARPLRRTGSTELALGAVTLLVASMLVNVAPPTEVADAASGAGQPAGPAATATPEPLRIIGSDYGTTLRLVLTVSPGVVGSNVFSARVTDYDTGAPVPATAIRLTFRLPARPDIGSSTLELQRQDPGVFAGTGANLSLAGSWLVSALVAEPATSVQVDLQVLVQAAPQQIDVNRVAGLPAIYTVHIGSGRTVQVYLDPGTPGANLLHATWFGANGKEMPVSNVEMAALDSSGGSTALQPQILDSGHEAAPVQVAALPATFLITGTGPGGTQFRVQLQISQSS